MNKNIWCHRCGFHWLENFSEPDNKFGESATLRAQLADLENQRKEWQRIAQNNIAANVEKEREIGDLRQQIADRNLVANQLQNRISDDHFAKYWGWCLKWRDITERKRVGKVTVEADVLREENRRLTAINQDLRLANERLTRENAELESFRKLSGEFASWSKRDAIRDENRRLKQENQCHIQQIRSLQADLNVAHRANIDIEAHEAAWSINWQQKVRALEDARDNWKDKHDTINRQAVEKIDGLNKKLEDTCRVRDNWEKIAQQEANNAAWCRGILDAIGGFFSDAAKTDDAGVVTDGIFYSKLPKLVEDNLVFRMSPDPRVVELKKQIDKARQALGEIHYAVDTANNFLKGFKVCL